MSSQIDDSSIDSTYPVAGQDNDSQGFRDNFAAIKTGLGTAKSEISNLQSKVILKSPLTGTGVAINDLAGSKITNGNYTNFHGTSYTNSVSNTANINIENGSLQSFTLSTDTTFQFTNWPNITNYATVRVHFRSNGNIIGVGNSIQLGRRYTINEVNTTNFVSMGADPTATFDATISGSTLTVSSKSGGSLSVGTYINGSGVTAGTKIVATNSENPTLTGVGGTGTYTVDTSQTISTTTAMTGMTAGVVFVAANSQGSGTGRVQPWMQVSLTTEGTGDVVTSADFTLPILLNPNGSDQVIDAWTWLGGDGNPNTVYTDYIANLDSSNENYTSVNTGSVVITETTDSSTTTTGALTVAGGAGIVKNLNVGGTVIIDGDLTVSGNTTLTTTSITINDINDITNVDIVSPRNGDSLKYSSSSSKWTNNADLVEYQVKVAGNINISNGSAVFYIDEVALSLADGTQASSLKTLQSGKKYRFIQNDGSNYKRQLKFSTTPDTVVEADNQPGLRTITPYGTNVTYSGFPAGTAGSYTEIFVTQDTPSPLYLYAEEENPNLSLSATAVTFSNFAITGTSGQFTISNSSTLNTNQLVRISGTWSSSTAPYGYDPAGSYYYIALGSTGTSFRLLSSPNGAGAQTTVGTPNGTLLTVVALTQTAPFIDNSKVGAEYPIVVNNGPVKIVNDYAVVGNQDILVDTTANAVTITLPIAPIVGTVVRITDTGNAGTNGIAISRGSNTTSTINGTQADISLSGDYASVILISNITTTNAGNVVSWTAIYPAFNGSDEVSPSEAISLGTTVSYFSVSGTVSATLAAGTEGQVKVLVMQSASGTMTVTVSNAGWKSSGSGTVAFNRTGDSCYLQYVQNKWYVVGNNGGIIEGITPIESITAPSTANATGRIGQIAVDASYIYICRATNTWLRAPIASW